MVADAAARRDLARVAVQVAVQPADRVVDRAADRAADMLRDRAVHLAAANRGEDRAVAALAAIAAVRDVAEIAAPVDLVARADRLETQPARELVRPRRRAAGAASAARAVSKADRPAALRAVVTVVAGRVADSKAKAEAADAADLPEAATRIGSRCSTK